MDTHRFPPRVADAWDLSGLSAARLQEAPAAHFAAVGPLALDAEREIARELVRRARRLEAAEGAAGAAGREPPA